MLALDIRAGRTVAAPPADNSEIVTPEQAAHEPGKPRYSSPPVTKLNPIVDIDIDLSGASELFLVITDAGDGKSCDHADWVLPRFITDDGEQRLTGLKWKSVNTGFGDVRLNRNVSGGPLSIGGLKFEDGLGSHAPSVIHYEIPAGAKRFQARAGLDNGGTDQGGCGETASVQFRVYTERPNDFDLIMAGQVKPDQGVLSKAQADLVAIAYSDNGLLAIDSDHVEQILDDEVRQRLVTLRQTFSDAKASQVPMYPIAHVISDDRPEDMKVFIRGNPARQGDVAPRRFLKVLSDDEPEPFTIGSGRLELANRIASPDNPLTARVMANRVWQNHFGRGLVATPSNFGVLGERPTHPELLDYLASRLIDLGWSIKSLHREIMLSATYRLSSDHHAANAEIDGDNRYLWRMNRRRLDVEAWRDSLLAVAGRLDRGLSGPSQPLDSPDNVRRTVYGVVSRHELNSLLRLFDFPDANITSERRSETTVPQQQLFVLNSPFMIEQARALADRAFADGRPAEDQIRDAFVLLYGRPATDDEVEIGASFLRLPSTDSGELSRAQRYAQVLLGANEFTFVD
jgi:hypothetical protein